MVNEPTVAFESDAYSFAASAGTATLTIQREGSTSSSAVVDYAVSAAPGTDYSNSSGSATFTSGGSLVTINFSITDNATAHDDEVLTFNLNTPPAAPLLIPTWAAPL